jgi:hypothetical protein
VGLAGVRLASARNIRGPNSPSIPSSIKLSIPITAFPKPLIYSVYQDKDQKKWAPLHFFVPAIAGSLVAMTNKLGSWDMGVTKGFKAVSDFMYHYECSKLSCLISEYDENNASRYI